MLLKPCTTGVANVHDADAAERGADAAWLLRARRHVRHRVRVFVAPEAVCWGALRTTHPNNVLRGVSDCRLRPTHPAPAPQAASDSLARPERLHCNANA